MQSKLAGWKRNSLSLAGRVTLALSVLNAIPSYAMQSSALPASITSLIDSILRNFVWGSTPDSRKTHLLSWDSICRSKEQGGLGFRKARELNDAYLMKLGWTILKEPDRLWVQIFTSKYLKETTNGPTLRRKSGGSSLWRGIRRVWHDIATNCQHSIRNGQDTLFWTASWLDSGLSLADHALHELTDSDLQCSVADMVKEDGCWDWSRLHHSLPPHMISQVAGMSPPTPDGGDDDLIWGPDPKGRFTIKSAYDIIATSRDPSPHNTWNFIWKWQGPSRIKHFLWLAAHDRLLSNAERHRRHMTVTDNCHRCTNVSETSLHILRDCTLARDVWLALLPPGIVAEFFSGNVHEWIIKGVRLVTDSLLFGVTAWILWKARNEDIFDNKLVTCDQLRLRVLHWIVGVRETMRAESRVLSEVVGRRRETLLRWIPAPDEWLTVNCDGSVIQPGSLAAAGGIIRNSSVRKLGVFAANLGTCTITRAELRAASISLDMAWNMGARKVHLQVDSLVAVRAITGLCSDDSRHSHDIHQIQRMLERNWSVEVHHIYREKNRVADLLAHFGHSLNFGAHFDFTCNSDIERAISADCIGVCFPRLINFNE
ncbi:Putative ribonuclease H protein At1g65750 [Linum perenne]